MNIFQNFRGILVGLGVFLLAGLAEESSAAVVTRGPYLQMGTSSSVIIRWRTDVATDSRVQYGLAVGSLTSEKTDSTSTTEHEVQLTGLSPDTKYFYNVGSTSGILAGDATYFVVTNPTIGTAKATRIWVIGDAGFGNSDQANVRNAYQTFTGSKHTDLWLQLGDNSYQINRSGTIYVDGSDGAMQYGCMEMYTNMFRKSVCWPTIGNHDTVVANPNHRDPPLTLPYYQIFNLPKNAEAGGVASGTEEYYSFDYGNIHFICLNTYTESLSATGTMVNWLKADVAATTAKWIIAYFHHPVYTKGTSDSDQVYEIRQAFASILEGAGVDLVLAGHSHSYERSFFLNGHYGLSGTFNPATHVKWPGSGRIDGANGAYTKTAGANKGAVYSVVGSSGTTGGGPLNHPANYISLDVLGSLVLDISGNQMDAKFISDTGAVRDYYTIIKTSGGTPVLTSVTVTPTPATVAPGGTQAFSAVARDQFGLPMSPQPSFTWTFGGSAANGSVNSSGLFTAGSTEGGPFNVTATTGGISGSAQVSVASSTTVTYQDGVGGYAGTVDTYISEQAQTTAFTTDARLNVNYYVSATAPENTQVLMKFDLSAIPSNGVVTSASMTLHCTRTNQIDALDVMLMNKVTSAWAETHTWSAGVPTSEASGVTLPSLAAVGPTNAYVINGMSSLVQDWVRTPSSNHGVIFVGSGRMNYRFASREISTTTYRPKITVTYSMPTAAPSDSDSDGLPDTWENSNFGSLAQVGGGDFDGDGMTNADEFKVGSSPSDRNNSLKVTNERFTAGTNYEITWLSAVGKSYQVESSTDMVTWSPAATVPSGGSTTTWTQDAGSATRKFYRVKLP